MARSSRKRTVINGSPPWVRKKESDGVREDEVGGRTEEERDAARVGTVKEEEESTY